MSSKAVGGDRDRDLEAELEHGAAGYTGIAVDARCIGCRKVRAKRAPAEKFDEQEGRGVTFKHVCHNCQRATYWNVIRTLDDQHVGGPDE